MKKIYFVRHGESTGNAGTFRQGPNTPLSDLGMKQAKIVAERFRTISIDKVLVSTYLRAKQTAEAINTVLKKEIEYSDLMVERIKPSSMVEKPKDDPWTLEIDRLTEENFHNPDWKFEDGETFVEMKRRAMNVLKYVEQTDGENILIVTHGIFLRMLAACVIHGEDLTSQEYWRFYITLETDNTGLTVFKQDVVRGEKMWLIQSWNDSAHLGEIDAERNDSL